MRNYGASVRAKLQALSKRKQVEQMGLLIRYATDRLLFRLSVSEFSSSFILKDSLLFSVWNREMHRPTKDADLLGFGSCDDDYLLDVFKSVCSIEIVEDGLAFDLNSIKIEPIREEEDYDGRRIKCMVNLGGARIPVQIDIGFGDTVTPEPDEVLLPTLIELPPAKLYAYPKESVISEKTETLTKLGIANSRMKDFYDIKWLCDHYEFDGKVLSEAILATFKRRRTKLSDSLPVGLSEEFFADRTKQAQWNSFCNKLNQPPTDTFEMAGERLRAFLSPPLLESEFNLQWKPDSGWS